VRAVFYHGVVDRKERGHPLYELFTDVHEFEDEVRQLVRQWHPVSLAEVAEHVRTGEPLPDLAVHVSFDDGFRNNLVAAEILERHSVPWTLFVTVDAVLDGYRPWFSRLADALEATANVRRANGAVSELTRPRQKADFLMEVKAALMAAPGARMEQVLDEALSLFGMQPPDQERFPFLSPDELEELHRAGVEIGNHSGRHLNLVRCDDATLAAEVDGSRRRLEAALGDRVRFFAYPDGRYDHRVAGAVAVGHDLAMSVWRPGARWRPYAIPRRVSAGAGLDVALADRASARLCTDWARDTWARLPGEVRHRVRLGAGLTRA
jgi:peptidoglycan/xylan/chitin deacetylase (PgdA/CDA1 family)